MAYRLKTIMFHSEQRKILLQNENGPCPLLAAANALLLKGVINMPAESVRNGVASIDNVINALAERALKQSDRLPQEAHFQLDELMQLFPDLQYGMDVNPKFTLGPSGVEYTKNLTAFDLLGVELVHGWLLDPQDEEAYTLVGDKSYNQLIEHVINGEEAKNQIEQITGEIARRESLLESGGGGRSLSAIQAELNAWKKKYTDASLAVTEGTVINNFLQATSHQLTYHGLSELHHHLREGSLFIFFRNNHFATMTKHEGVLYLLVTDLGYANVDNVVWEKLDAIDGDTEYTNEWFNKPPPQDSLLPTQGPALTPEQMLAQSGQVEADHRLALSLSHGQNPTRNLDEEEGRLMAAATEASLREYNGRGEEEKTEELSSHQHQDYSHLLASNIAAAEGQFVPSEPTPHQLMPSIEESDRELALRMAQRENLLTPGSEESDRAIAERLARMEVEDESEKLARLLQNEELARDRIRQGAASTAARAASTAPRAAPTRPSSTPSTNSRPTPVGGSKDGKGCVIC